MDRNGRGDEALRLAQRDLEVALAAPETPEGPRAHANAPRSPRAELTARLAARQGDFTQAERRAFVEDALASFTFARATDAERLHALAHVPEEHGELALRALRAADERALTAIIPSPPDLVLRDQDWPELLARAQGLACTGDARIGELLDRWIEHEHDPERRSSIAGARAGWRAVRRQLDDMAAP